MSKWTKLRELREAAGLSRPALSERAGVSETQLYRLETGRTDYKKTELGTAEALAAALGVTVDELAWTKDDVETLLYKMRRMDPRFRQTLKREAGKRMDDANPRAYMAFYSILPAGIDEEDSDTWFQAACIAAFCIDWNKEIPHVELAAALGEIDANNGVDMMKHRMTNALDTSWGDDAYAAELVYKLARVAVQNEYNVDLRKLIRDILNWNDPDQDTAKCWIDAYLVGAERGAHADGDTETD